LYPDVFTPQTADAFKSAFDLTRGSYNTQFIESASALLAKMMLRRMKVDIDEIKLPPKEELLVYVPLTPLQRYLLSQLIRFWYKRLITRLDNATLNDVFNASVKPEEDKPVKEEQQLGKRGHVNAESKIVKPEESYPQIDLQDGRAWAKLMNLLMQLRKVCDQYSSLAI
jgi:SWI/SNF-related matrix-associated actin-dependent regulator of chromatin subfamily A member 5